MTEKIERKIVPVVLHNQEVPYDKQSEVIQAFNPNEIGFSEVSVNSRESEGDTSLHNHNNERHHGIFS